MVADRAVCHHCFTSLLRKRLALPTVMGVNGEGFNLEECPGCGVRFEAIAQGGLFGCPACYASFNKFASAVMSADGAAKRTQ